MRKFKVSVSLQSGAMHFMPRVITAHSREKAIRRYMDGLGLSKTKAKFTVKYRDCLINKK